MGLPRIILSTLSNYGRQLAFAMAPIPAYLPQYFTLCNTNDPVLQRRKKLILQPAASKGSQCNTLGSHNGNLHKTNKSKHNDQIIIGMDNNNSINFDVVGGKHGSSKPITEGGFSSTSIMILLLSHIFRLQYFIVSAILSTFDTAENTENTIDGINNTNTTNKADKVHFDLVMQSFVMIGIQFLLLSAVTRRRRLSHKDKVHNDDEELISLSPLLSSQTKTTTTSSSSLSQKPFVWVYKPNQHWRWDTVNQHVELIILIIIFEYIVCRYYLYPNDFINYIQAVKNISVLLESCLALPQMILNYKRKSTDGLSLLMVIGWVLGDLLKLAYFISSYYNSNSDSFDNTKNVVVVQPHKEESVSSDMITFMIGSLFALGLDTIVMLQLIKWYPTKEYMSLEKRIKHSMIFKHLFGAGRQLASTRRFFVDEISP